MKQFSEFFLGLTKTRPNGKNAATKKQPVDLMGDPWSYEAAAAASGASFDA